MMSPEEQAVMNAVQAQTFDAMKRVIAGRTDADSDVEFVIVGLHKRFEAMVMVDETTMRGEILKQNGFPAPPTTPEQFERLSKIGFVLGKAAEYLTKLTDFANGNTNRTGQA